MVSPLDAAYEIGEEFFKASIALIDEKQAAKIEIVFQAIDAMAETLDKDMQEPFLMLLVSSAIVALRDGSYKLSEE